MKKYILFTGLLFLFFLHCVSFASIPVTLQTDPSIACVGYSISFSVNSNCSLCGATYYWDFGDGTGDTTSNPFTSHSYSTIGTFTVSVLVVTSSDSGSASTSVNIYKLGSFKIDAIKVYDIPEHLLWFHIHAYQIELKDTEGNNWNSGSTHPVVKYEWYNCADGKFFDSGYASSYTFQSVFGPCIGESIGVNGRVSCERNESHSLLSNNVSFWNTNKKQ